MPLHIKQVSETNEPISMACERTFFSLSVSIITILAILAILVPLKKHYILVESTMLTKKPNQINLILVFFFSFHSYGNK